jgi:hypothetical protein
MSLRDLNWRKGFFRLWLLASLIWIVAFGIVGVYPATMDYIESTKAERQVVLFKTGDFKKRDAAMEKSFAALKREKPDASLEELAKDVEDALNAAREATRYQETKQIAELKASREKDLLVCSGMTFLLPALALVLGMGFMWVFSGFVPKQSNSHEGKNTGDHSGNCD